MKRDGHRYLIVDAPDDSGKPEPEEKCVKTLSIRRGPNRLVCPGCGHPGNEAP